MGKDKARSLDASFVIPCFRSTSALKSLVADPTDLARKRLQRFEIVLVRDSTDPDTTFLLDEIAKAIAKAHEETLIIKLSRNFGQQAATVAGITESIGDVVVTLDDDYQHRPTDALEMVAALANYPNLDLVYARPLEASDSRNSIITGRLFRRVLKYAGIGFADSLSPFRAFRGYFREAFTPATGPNISVDVILSWVVDQVKTVRVGFNARLDGRSGYSTLPLFKLALGLVIAYTTRPLRTGIYLGLFGVTASFVFGAVVLGNSLIGGIAVPGFATTILIVLFLGSLQLLELGIAGFYIGEQHRRGIKQPAYSIDKS